VFVNVSNLSILGAQAGKDARVDRTDPSAESIVDASTGASGSGNGAGFLVNAANVVIDGFTIQGGTTGLDASGIYVSEQILPQIVNNIIENNCVGLYLKAPIPALVEYNLFKANNQPTLGAYDYFIPGPGFGIAGYSLNNQTIITENAFEGNLAAAIFFYGSFNTEINNNTSKDDGSFFVCSDCGMLSFDHNQGRDFGAKGFLPITLTTNADAAVDLLWTNSDMQINDNILEGGKTADYSGIAFSNMNWYYFPTSTTEAPDIVCEHCQVSGNTISRFAGNGIVAEAYEFEPTLNYSMISRNDVEDNGHDGILIGFYVENENEWNSLLDNKAKGNQVFDCEDDTSNSLTLGTYNTWFNNIGSLSSPTGLCRPPGGIMTPLGRD
jgi:hypothetical protein